MSRQFQAKQTAVEWFIDWLMDNPIISDGYIEAMIKAKAMEKEQIINARIDGDENHTFNSQMREEYANDYYNETYGIE